MNLYKLELKRLLKTKSVRISIIFSILITFFLSYIPIYFERYVYINDQGVETIARGLEAISMEKENWKPYGGELTPEKIAQGLDTLQKLEKQYGKDAFLERVMPRAEYYKNIAPIYHIKTLLHQVYIATDIKSNIQDLTREDALNFYNRHIEGLNLLMKINQSEYPNAIKQAINLYSHVKTPFTYYPLADNATLEYLAKLITILIIILTIIAAPIFASEYQTGSNNILRCTKFGGKYLAKTKIKACLTLCILLYLFCTSIFIIILNNIFGWEIYKTSIQMLYFTESLPAITVGQTQFIVILFGLLALIAILCFILFVSNVTKSVYASIIIAFSLFIMQTIIGSFLDKSLYMLAICILPSGGVNVLNNILFELSSELHFINFGSFSLWLPIGLFIGRILEIPIFIYLVIHSYCKDSLKLN